MNKKFLSAILFGALMVTSTGTFVSCKDYDDDIKDLQEQIDKLATKDDLTAQINTLQAALTTAASNASEAITKATAAETAAKAAGDDAAAAKAAADKAVEEAKAESIKAVQAELDALKEELTEATETALQEMSEQVAEATKKVEAIVGEIADMVTSVELVESYTAENGQWNSTDGMDPVIVLSTTIEKDNVFSKDITNAITFVKGAQVQTPNSFLIRVSPTNAVLTKDMISLVNSQGANLDDVLEVVSVKKSDVLLSRAATNSGLWEVTVQLKNYDEDAFEAATTTDDEKSILFAVQVNNSLTTSAVRYATSSYDLTLGWKEYEPASELNFFVDNTNVAAINNRYDNTSKSLKETNAEIVYEELTWSGVPAVAPTTNPSNTKQDESDNRSPKAVYPAVQGQALKISLTENATDDKVSAPENIRAIYVTLDEENAVESAPSELNAWKSYTYTGLDTVVEGTSIELIINSPNAINDIIGFRVYAVNFDGTLVDPDGKAFYVNLGNVATDWNAVATTVTALNPADLAVTSTKSNEVAASLSKLTGATAATWTTDKIDNSEHVFDAYFVDADGKVIYDTRATSVNSFPEDFSKVAKIYTMPAGIRDWAKYEDNKTYTGTLTIKNATGHVLATIKVSMTKVLPTTIPAGFSVKTAQVANGVYNCYMIPDTWVAKAATEGTMKMSEVFNFGDGTPANYNITFAASKEEGNEVKGITVSGDGVLTVAENFINNSTQHATTVVYNYGKISSVKNAQGGYDDVTRAATDFQTIYNCIYNSTYTWAWATREQLGDEYTAKNNNGTYVKELPYKTELTYGTDYDLTVDSYIYGTSAWDGLYSAMLNAPYEGSLVIESATLTSDANGEEEYFTVTVENKHITGFNAIDNSSTTNPTAAVPSTLTITCKDMYGHDVVIEVPMTVNKR